MRIVAPKYILTPHQILTNKAVAFDEKIVAIDTLENLQKRFPHSSIEHFDGAMLPTFANPHVHLEFSANEAMLSYGDFIPWLYSVIKNREELLPRCDAQCLEQAIDALLCSGTTAIGQISSYGEEMEVCAKSALQVVFFNEIIGSNAAAADVMYASFIERFHRAKKLESEDFKAAVAVHSPYSVHYILAKKAIEIAKKYDTLVSVHFMESQAERQWLDSGTGEFAKFFDELLGQKRPVNDVMEFLELFKDVRTLFVHMVHANDTELARIKTYDAAIIHCPISNRLLGNGVLDLERIAPLPWTLATDGLSSNYSLNMYEEMRAALFMHPHSNAVQFAKELICNATRKSHELLGFAGGEIAEGAPATFQLVSTPKDLQLLQELYLHIILHTQKPQRVYIKGARYGK